MAATDLSGFNGAVTLPSSIGGSASGFTFRRQMNTKPTNRYGGNRFARARGGIVSITGDIRLFLQMSASSTSPNLVAPLADGAALTLQFETGCTASGTALFPDLNIDHSFGDPAIEATQSFMFTGTVTEVWAVA